MPEMNQTTSINKGSLPPITNSTNSGKSHKALIWTIIAIVVVVVIIIIATSGGNKNTTNTNTNPQNNNQEQATTLPDTTQAQYNGLATSDDDFAALDDAMNSLE